MMPLVFSYYGCQLGAFRTLCDKLQTSYGLQPTLNVGIEESVAMFLRICGHNEVQRDVGLRFGRTQETVNRKFFEVLKATELLACDYIRTPTTQELRQIPERLVMDQRYWPYFSGFVGAMDGVHVCVKVKPEVQGMYWNRHNITSFNIMAICDLNMLFTYVWNGAPGSCHDTAVLTMAQERDSDFPLPPPDKYYLVDSGYPNKQGFLAPLDLHGMWLFGIICHNLKMVLLLETSKSCLIDIMHLYVLLLKGLLEYGRRNGGFFVNFLGYDKKVQKRVVMATMGLHNFIRISNFSDEDFADVRRDTEIGNTSSMIEPSDGRSGNRRRRFYG
ncbi:unnamed protein product [Microthlaspi erraticum]|uniref:Uncharacterized protein n=1 Tax=Microthlaspi erraticum TaxID=1685480 RepID=A0A6D2K7K3_9BRAS|nr:unnamed protein product [Microthlaspi erraticum]